MPNETKYELMTQLRELNRGYPRMAIASLKKHELEARIDALKKYRAIEDESSKLFKPAKSGPPGPRNIEVKEDGRDREEGEDFVRMPSIPAPRVSDYSIMKAKKEAKAKEADPFLQIPAEKPLVRPTKVQNTISYDTDPPVRGKSEPVMYNPGAQKCPKCGSDKYHVH